jgi:hypothetical protein
MWHKGIVNVCILPQDQCSDSALTTPEHVDKLLTIYNERGITMNTITVKNEHGDDVTYTQAEVLTFIRQASYYVQERDSNDKLRFKVRDFFSEELDWSGGEATVQRDSVNDLLIAIGAGKLQTKWTARVTIEATISGYTAEDEDDAIACIEQDLDIGIGSSADIEVDGIDVYAVEEE